MASSSGPASNGRRGLRKNLPVESLAPGARARVVAVENLALVLAPLA